MSNQVRSVFSYLTLAGVLAFAGAMVWLTPRDASRLSTDREPASDQVLTVYLVHGFKGSVKSFCDFGLLLEESVRALTGRPVRVVTIPYDTNDSDARTFKLTRQIYTGIKEDLLHNGLGLEAPYSLVLHSQAGNLGLKYLRECLTEFHCDKEGEGGAPRNLRHVVSLGSPFWGAPIASVLKRANELNQMVGVPQVQIQNMAVGSFDSLANRRFLLSKNSMSGTPLPPGVTLHALAGDISSTLFMGNVFKFSQGASIQTDMTVDAPSARPDFYYYIESETEGGPVASGRTAIGTDYRIFKMTHTDVQGYRGIACAKNGDLKHPSVDYIAHLVKAFYSGVPAASAAHAWVAPETTPVVDKAESFAVEIRVHTPTGYMRPISLRSNVVIQPSDRLQFSNLETADPFWLQRLSDLQRLQEQFQPQKTANRSNGAQNFYHAGNFKIGAPYESTGQRVPSAKIAYDIRVPGWEARKLELTVSPSYSSYADIWLTPKSPFRDFDPAREDDRYVQNKSRVLMALTGGLKGLVAYTLPTTGAGPLKKEEMTTSAFAGWSQSLASNEWLKRRDACAMGVTGQIEGLNRNEVFASFDAKAATTALPAGKRVLVLGRFSRGKIYSQRGNFALHAEDRYLVRRPDFHTPDNLAWMNVTDLDVVADPTCNANFSGFHPSNW